MGNFTSIEAEFNKRVNAEIGKTLMDPTINGNPQAKQNRIRLTET